MPHPNSKRAKAAKSKRVESRRATTADDRRVRSERRAAQQERRDITHLRRRRAARAWTVLAVGGLLVIAGFVGYVLWGELRPGPELAGVERPPNEGRGHVTGARYASETPTSGPHSTQAPRCGTYTQPLDPSLAVHALEHGAVVLWYDSARPALAEDLTQSASEWDSHVIISPSNNLDDAVVATAWNRQKSYDEVTPEVTEFIDTYRQRGPEQVDCDRT